MFSIKSKVSSNVDKFWTSFNYNPKTLWYTFSELSDFVKIIRNLSGKIVAPFLVSFDLVISSSLVTFANHDIHPVLRIIVCIGLVRAACITYNYSNTPLNV